MVRGRTPPSHEGVNSCGNKEDGTWSACCKERLVKAEDDNELVSAVELIINLHLSPDMFLKCSGGTVTVCENTNVLIRSFVRFLEHLLQP